LMNLALPTLITPSLTVLLYICLLACIYAELRDACVRMGIVVLGVCGGKPAREGVLGTLAGVSSKQPIWDWGRDCTPQCIPTFTIFGA
jgi:hypothetical protein